MKKDIRARLLADPVKVVNPAHCSLQNKNFVTYHHGQYNHKNCPDCTNATWDWIGAWLLWLCGKHKELYLDLHKMPINLWLSPKRYCSFAEAHTFAISLLGFLYTSSVFKLLACELWATCYVVESINPKDDWNGAICTWQHYLPATNSVFVSKGPSLAQGCCVSNILLEGTRMQTTYLHAMDNVLPQSTRGADLMRGRWRELMSMTRSRTCIINLTKSLEREQNSRMRTWGRKCYYISQTEGCRDKTQQRLPGRRERGGLLPAWYPVIHSHLCVQLFPVI